MSCSPFQKAAKAVWREEQTRLPRLVAYPFAGTLQRLAVVSTTPEQVEWVTAFAFIAC